MSNCFNNNRLKSDDVSSMESPRTNCINVDKSDSVTPQAVLNQSTCPRNISAFAPTTAGFHQSFQANNAAEVPNRNLSYSNLPINRDPNMTIQIGFQCLNQNRPININANEFPANGLKRTMELDNIPFGGNSRNGSVNGSYPTDGVMPNTRKINGVSNGFDNSIRGQRNYYNSESLAEIVRVGLYGCDAAENITNLHRNRPCFKKIDSLCARLRQDFMRPDNIVPNINSQGIAWAIKDLIFVFTRIMGAWIILKGYVYSDLDGLCKLKSSFSSEFTQRFVSWQNETAKFVTEIIHTFLMLNEVSLAQKSCQKNRSYTKMMSTPVKMSGESVSNLSDYFISDISDPDINDKSFHKNYELKHNGYYEDNFQEDTGTYIRTGKYTPLPKSALISPEIPEVFFGQNCSQTNLGNYPHPVAMFQRPRCEGDGSPTPIQTKFNSSIGQQASSKQVNLDFGQKLELLVERISNLSKGTFFLKTGFARNYFPEFTGKHPDFMDLRTIIFKAQVGGYNDMYQVVHDLRLIIHLAKKYLMTNQNEFLKNSVIEYENEINIILTGDEFQNFKFDHISGDPNENVYPS